MNVEKDIFYAIEHSDIDLLKELIQLGADVNSCDGFNQTPLHLAIDSAYEEAIYIFDTEGKYTEPRTDIIKILLTNGASLDNKDLNGKTPINWVEDRKDNSFLRSFKQLVRVTAPNNMIDDQAA